MKPVKNTLTRISLDEFNITHNRNQLHHSNLLVLQFLQNLRIYYVKSMLPYRQGLKLVPYQKFSLLTSAI